MNITNTMKKKKRKLKRFQDKGYSTKGAQISSASSFVIIAIFFAAPFHRSSKWLAARCLMASRFLVFFLFRVVLARPFFPQFSPVDSKAVQRSALCRSRRELSNEYFTIYLQNVASIQPRTSPEKFARSPRTDPPGHAGDRGSRHKWRRRDKV